MLSERIAKIKRDFPVANRSIDGNAIVYLDSAATSLKPQRVIDAIVRYYAEVGANIHRGKHYLSDIASTDFEEARGKVAGFLGCAAAEVIFVQNTTHALNVVASGIRLNENDLVVVQSDAHHSALLPWRQHARVEHIEVSPDGVIDIAHYEKLLTMDPRVVVLTHCSNVTGFYAPIDPMARMAKKVGLLVVVDAAQSIPHRRFRLHGSNIDFLAFSGHKMLGPTGVGVLCGQAESLGQLRPLCHGGGMVDWVDYKTQRLRKLPQALEAGTPDIAGVYGLAAAIDYLEGLGAELVAEHDRALAKQMHAEAAARDGLCFALGKPDVDRSAILSFSIPGTAISEVARALSDSYGIMCRSGHMCCQPFVQKVYGGEVLRASAYVYTSEEDVKKFFDALDEVRRFL